MQVFIIVFVDCHHDDVNIHYVLVLSSKCKFTNMVLNRDSLSYKTQITLQNENLK